MYRAQLESERRFDKNQIAYLRAITTLVRDGIPRLKAESIAVKLYNEDPTKDAIAHFEQHFPDLVVDNE